MQRPNTIDYQTFENSALTNDNSESNGPFVTIEEPPEVKSDDELAPYKRMIDKQNYLELSHVLTFKKLTKEQQTELVNYYKSKNSLKNNVILAHAVAGYFGEFFYLYWDVVSRLEVCPKLFPGVDKTLLEIANYAATPFIAAANITYNPKAEADGYMKKVMLDPNASLGKVTRANGLLTLSFILYSFGGGYIEVQQLNDWMDKNFGNFKYIPIALLIYTAICYYVAFNFEDTIEGVKNWKEQDSLLKKAFSCSNKESLGERWTALFVGVHEFATFIERITRIGYGGFVAGMQNTDKNTAAGFSLGGVIALASMPVALGTRVMNTRNQYYPQSLTRQEYALVETHFNNRHAGFCGAIKREIKFILNPTLFLNVPASLFAFNLGSDLIDEPKFNNWITSKSVGGAFAATTSMLVYALTRIPAKRKEIVAMASAIKAAATNAEAKVINFSGKLLAASSNVLDQTSRTLTLGYMLQDMLPDLFDTNSDSGQMNMFRVLCLQAFIASSAFYYQNKKGEGAFLSIAPCLFGKTANVVGRQPLSDLVGTPPGSPKTAPSSPAGSAPSSPRKGSIAEV